MNWAVEEGPPQVFNVGEECFHCVEVGYRSVPVNLSAYLGHCDAVGLVWICGLKTAGEGSEHIVPMQIFAGVVLGFDPLSIEQVEEAAKVQAIHRRRWVEWIYWRILCRIFFVEGLLGRRI